MIHDMMHAVNLAEITNDAAPAATKSAPSNAQILAAAKSAYAQEQPIVDASTMALVNIIKTGSLNTEITALDGTNWQSGGVTETVVDPIFASPDVQTAIGATRAPVKCYSVGVFSNALPDGKVGMIGFARSLQAQAASGITLELDLYKKLVGTTPGQNLQFGQWVKDPKDLHDQIYGLYINTAVRGVSVDLKIVLDINLTVYGFVESTGANLNLPVTVSPFGGSTANW